MAVADKLRQEGWYLTTEGIEQVTENGAIADIKAIIRKAIDFDLKEIGDSTFFDDILKSKVESLDGHRVVQIQKIRNLSAPKANEESKVAPRMLKLLLTDGTSSCQAIEVEHLPALSLNTPPGTKLRFKPGVIPVVHGMIQLRPNLLEFLGGRVAPLVEKWELNRTLAKHTRGRIGEEGGPPPWIQFGQKIIRAQPNDRNFKSLNSGKENKENPEFEAQRKDAIAEAARAGNKKVFGGGTKQMLDHNVQQIVDLGFSVSQAEYALKQNRNNVDRALRSLQRREDTGVPKPSKPEMRGRRKGERDKEDEGAVAKPSAKVSLFDFLEDKLPNLNEREPEPRRGNSYGERRGGGGDRRNHDLRGDYHHREQNHGSTGERRGGGERGGGERGGYSRQYQSSDSSSNWNSDRMGRQSDRGQGQKPPRFQQQAQRFQQKQQQQQQQHHPQSSSSSKQSPTHNNSPFDSYQTWSSGNSEFQNQWGSFSAFSGITNDSLGKDVFKQNNRSNNDDHIGQWKPPAHRDRWKNDEDQFKSRPPPLMQQQFNQPPPSQSSQHTAFSEFSSRREEASSSRNSQIFGAEFSLSGSQLNFSSFQSPPPDQSSSSVFIPDKLWEWHEGDKCMAKYWEDNRHYRAEVTGVSSRTVVVRFVEYGNFEEVLHEDCIPITEYD